MSSGRREGGHNCQAAPEDKGTQCCREGDIHQSRSALGRLGPQSCRLARSERARAASGGARGLGVTRGRRKVAPQEIELQQETELQATQQEPEEVHKRAEIAKATLGSERTAFMEAKESLKGDLGQALIAKDATEARVKTVILQCQ